MGAIVGVVCTFGFMCACASTPDIVFLKTITYTSYQSLLVVAFDKVSNWHVTNFVIFFPELYQRVTCKLTTMETV